MLEQQMAHPESVVIAVVLWVIPHGVEAQVQQVAVSVHLQLFVVVSVVVLPQVFPHDAEMRAQQGVTALQRFESVVVAVLQMLLHGVVSVTAELQQLAVEGVSSDCNHVVVVLHRLFVKMVLPLV
jgi:hypothetical protein